MGEGLKLTKKRHGQSGTYTYQAWAKLKQRCKEKQEPLCLAWWRYQPFRDDMGRRPDNGHLRRLDPSLAWGPGNAIWRIE